MDLESIIKLDELERKGYLGQIRDLARYPTCNIYWSTGVRQLGSQIIANGTMTFINLNNQIIGITNNHVYEGFIKSKRFFNDTECQIGGATIDLEECLISCNKDSDLATFDIPEIILNQAGSYYLSTTERPPQKVLKGDHLICGGYPGLGGSELINRVDSDFVSFICDVTEVKEEHFVIQLDLESSYWPQGLSIGEAYREILEPMEEGVEQIVEQTLLGGISGGPVYRFIDSPIFRLEVVGFIFQSCYSDILFATYSHHIDEFGQVVD